MDSLFFINEISYFRCSVNNGGCSHICLPAVQGERKCNCTTGYELLEDGVTCKGME